MEDNIMRFREIGDPILKVKCKEVDIKNIGKNEKQTILDLKSTFNYSNGFGIAAPQIGRTVRIIVIGVNKDISKYKDSENVPVTIMINPVITFYSKSKTNEYEGCFSVPSIRGLVERAKSIKVEFYDEKLKKQKWCVSGYTARLIQHEVDHLDGICFIERVLDNSSFTTHENLTRFINKK
jgi:peptide deformylase